MIKLLSTIYIVVLATTFTHASCSEHNITYTLEDESSEEKREFTYFAKLYSDLDDFVGYVEFYYRPNKTVGKIKKLIVDKEYRKQGIGRKLMMYALTHLFAQNCTFVQWESRPEVDAEEDISVEEYTQKYLQLINWYKKFGANIAKTKPCTGLPDRVTMQITQAQFMQQEQRHPSCS